MSANEVEQEEEEETPSSESPLRPGDVLGGRFVVERIAGAGGMGTVYRGVDRTTGAPVALKVVKAGSTESSRFAHEIKTLSELEHPAIVRYIGHGVRAGGQLFLAMEWLDGEDLSHRLKRVRLNDAETLAIVSSVASALGAAHALGIVHRDVKPSNIFLVGLDPRAAKLLDFGIARPITSARLLTLSGALVGTPPYMSPEQASGERVLDGRSDVFSLGCVLFECLAGRRLRTGSDPLAVIAQALLDDAPRLSALRPGIDRNLESVVARALARGRSARPANGHALALELAAIADGTLAPVPTSTEIAGGEQRLRTAVIVRLAPRRGGTLTGAPLAHVRSALEPVVTDAGGRMEALGESVLLASIPPAPLPRDQATRAARLALRIRELSPAAQVAVTTVRGPVVAGDLGGDLVSRGLALIDATPAPDRSSQATPINLDALTADLIGDRFVIAREHELQFLTREAIGGGGELRLLGRPSHCVGREKELAQLDGVLAECASDSLARAVVIVGDPGSGKSRLCDELTARAARRNDRLRIVRAYGQSEQAGAPFTLVAGIVRSLVGIARSASADEARAAVTAWANRDGDAVAAKRTAALLGEIVAAPFPDDTDEALNAARRDAQLMADLTRGAWRQLVAREADCGELLIVLEDIHWGDLTSIRFIEVALRDLDRRPFAVLATGRPELRATFPELWNGLRVDELALAPLSARAAEKIVRGALGDAVPAPVMERILEHAGGNPLYLEELIRASARGDDALPVSVLAAVQARLDAAGEDGKRLLRAASVFGERFWLAGVDAIAPTGEDTACARRVLSDLIDRELIVPSVHARLPRQTEFAFRHAVFREAAYALWLDDDRATAHRIAARWLEEAGERNALVLAEHCRLGGLEVRAAEGYRTAAEQALRGGDLAGAIRWGQTAAECLARAAGTTEVDAEGLARIRLVQADAHYFRGEVAASEVFAREAAARLEPATESWYRALAIAISAAGQQGANDRVRAFLEDVLAEPAPTPLVSRVVETLGRGVTQLTVGGDPELVARCGEALETLAAQATLDPQARQWIARATISGAFVRGELEAMLAATQVSLEACDACGDLRGVAFVRILRANGHLALGEFSAAEEEARRARAGAERIGASYLVTWSRLAAGKVEACRGELTRARAELDFVIESAVSSPRIMAGANMYVSYAAHESAAFEVAAAAAREALGLKIAPSARASALALLARALLGSRDHEAALEAAREANTIADSVGHVEEFEVLVRLAYGEALERVGRRDEARLVIQRVCDQLVARAEGIRDPVRRDAFLAHRAENAAVMRLALVLGQADVEK